MQNEYDKRSAHIKAEKEKAKILRKSHWWKNLCQNAHCYYCQAAIPASEVTMDHIVPLSRGGYSKKGNLVPCCKTCNTNKKDKTAVELILAQLNDKSNDAS
jgi:5-methylcytosine-specific restriction endonuclease McrA